MPRAIAVDLGASSGRIAIGELVDGRIDFQVVEQIAHEAHEIRGRLRWDLDLILGLCRRAKDLAGQNPGSSLGIDSWGVDHGFLDRDGALIDSPVCYRDLSHVEAFERLSQHRSRLYELTGIQHQPFNTICQLVARRLENPHLPEVAKDWMILPDLLGYLLGGERRSELTQCSTTQLMGLSGSWSEEAFAIAGWPLPGRQPGHPGKLVSRLDNGADLVSVGSHDTASAVLGFGELKPTDIFLNVGTWSLAGCILDEPIATQQSASLGFTNERAVHGKIRFLKNIPGFYFMNRLHDELGIKSSVPEWLKSAVTGDCSIDLLHPDFFNPDSMLSTCSKRLARVPADPPEWAGIALRSLAEAVSRTRSELERLTGKTFSRIRVGGGGSQSEEFCYALSRCLGLEVSAGPAESTVLGNLAAQFVAQGAISDFQEAEQVANASISLVSYLPA